MKNFNVTDFWKKLPRPFFVLAPMADVTDAAFRSMIADRGRPDVMWTEFVAADGLMHAPKTPRAGETVAPYDKLARDLVYEEKERPIVAQFFTSHPDAMRGAALIARDLGFDGIDINMGCPDKTIEKQGAGAAMIKTPNIAVQVIRTAKEAGLPVSVKTRIGFNKNEIEKWIPVLLAERPAALTLHCRTRKEMSKVPARWEHVAEVVRLRDRLSAEAINRGEAPIETLIIGNGDVKDIPHARRLVAETGCDGVMLGRAIFGNPWLFSEHNRKATDSADVYVPTVPERLRTMVEHTKRFEHILGDIKNFAIMKKHYKAYVNNFDGAVELRAKLMEATDAAHVEEITEAFLKDM